MSEREIGSIGRRLLWIGGIAIGSTITAAFGAAVINGVGALVAGTPVGLFDLLSLPIGSFDLWTVVLVLAICVIELAYNGWSASGLRRVLSRGDATTRTDLVYAIISSTGLMTVATVGLTLGISSALDVLGERGLGLRLFAGLPLYVAVPLVLVAQSFASYWCHRLMHTAAFWPLHAVHHAASDFNTITVFRHHPIDGLVSGLAMPLFPALLGMPAEAILAGNLILVLHAAYAHAALPTSSFVERWFFFGPHGHGIHHAADPSCIDTNFGDLVIWDRLFGTYKTDLAEPFVYGCADPDGVYQSGRPLHDIMAVQVLWLRRLRHTAARMAFPTMVLQRGLR